MLRERGYIGITMRELMAALLSDRSLPPKPIVITLDDGYRDAYTEALPLLRRYGFPATFFVLTGVADEQHPGYMSWEQIAELDAAGMDIEAHGRSHVDLRNRSVDYLVWQLLGAREAIEARLHKPVQVFCYPSGQYDDLVIQVSRSAHYVGAVTTQPGVDHSAERSYQLSRIRVSGSYRAQDLENVVRAYAGIS